VQHPEVRSIWLHFNLTWFRPRPRSRKDLDPAENFTQKQSIFAKYLEVSLKMTDFSKVGTLLLISFFAPGFCDFSPSSPLPREDGQGFHCFFFLILPTNRLGPLPHKKKRSRKAHIQAGSFRAGHPTTRTSRIRERRSRERENLGVSVANYTKNRAILQRGPWRNLPSAT